MKEYKMYIDGQWCDASDGKTVNVINPATEEYFARTPSASKEDVERAIQAAHNSFEKGDWRNMQPAERSRIMLDIVKKIREKTADFAKLETENNGFPARLCAPVIIGGAVNRFEWFAKAANRVFEDPLPLFRGAAMAMPYIKREPVGVCAQIIPWNSPTLLGAMGLGGPLATGNSLVIKPSILTPCTLLEMVKLIDESEVPKGVVNIVTGPGGAIGDVLASHPLVDKVTFTGSNEIGKRVLSLAAETIKKATMELGGKSALIILDDCDMDLAVAAAVYGCYVNSGQICYATTRALVPESMYNEFVQKLVEKVKKLTVGDPTDINNVMGPLVSVNQKTTVERYIKIGVQEGATLACGGGRPKGLDKGFYIEPTVFADVDNRMTIAQEEIFGPVLCVIKYKGDDEAVRIANDSRYGLLGAVFGKNIERAIGIGEKLRTGNVWINELHSISMDLPYGGVKQSGIGRERGEGLINEYTEVKSIQIDLGHSLAQRAWYGAFVPK